MYLRERKHRRRGRGIPDEEGLFAELFFAQKCMYFLK
jgi:hypothetical protein